MHGAPRRGKAPRVSRPPPPGNRPPLAPGSCEAAGRGRRGAGVTPGPGGPSDQQRWSVCAGGPAPRPDRGRRARLAPRGAGAPRRSLPAGGGGRVALWDPRPRDQGRSGRWSPAVVGGGTRAVCSHSSPGHHPGAWPGAPEAMAPREGAHRGGAPQTGWTVRRASDPPAHRQDKPSERCWGLLAHHGHGPLRDAMAAVSRLATTRPGQGPCPVVARVTTTSQTGVQRTNDARQRGETPRQRLPGVDHGLVASVPTSSTIPAT